MSEAMLIDVHTHTLPWSDDSLLYPTDLINQAKQVGLDGICLTEHDWFWDVKAVAELGEEHDFLIIPGVEITAEEGHLLVFGLEKYIFGMHHAAFVKKLVDEAGGAIIVAHPYRRQFPASSSDEDSSGYYPAIMRACENRVFELADAIETFNGRARERENAFSLEINQRLNLREVGGSDAHEVSDIGSCATVFERRVSNLREFITELKAGRFRAVNLRQNL